MSIAENEAKDPSKKHSCPYCGLSTRFKWNLTCHIRIHENNRPYECHICNRSFFSTCALKRHQNSHTGRRYACDKCPKNYGSDSGLRIHKKLHHATSYKCRICSETFDSTSEYQLHRKFHKEQSVLECSFCCKTFSSVKFKEEHEKGHMTPAERIQNPHRQRQKAFPKYEAIRNSPGTFSLNGNILVFKNKCNLCGCFVSSKSDFRSHFLSDHISTDDDHYNCKHCSFKTTSISQLKGSGKMSIYQHLTRHSKVKPYKCENCDYRSVRSGDVVSHYNSVHGEYKHDCGICHKKFRNIKDQKNHIKTHGDPDNKFKCDQCDKSFWFFSKLMVHKEIHMQNKYLCNLCGKSFSTFRNLSAHSVRHRSRQTREKAFAPLENKLRYNLDRGACLMYECFACGHISTTKEGASCCESLENIFS